MLQKIFQATGGGGYLAGVGSRKGKSVEPATDRQPTSASPDKHLTPANHDSSNGGSCSTFPPSQGTSGVTSPDSSTGSNHPTGPHLDNRSASGVDAAPSQIARSRPSALPPEMPPNPTTLTSTYPLVCGDSVGGRYGHSATAIGGSIVVFGGARGVMPSSQLSDELAILEVGTMRWRLESGSVRRAGDAPLKTYLHGAAALGTKLWVFGGLQGSRDKRAPTSALHSLDLQTGFWAKASGSTDTPSPRHGHAMTATSAAIYVFGGRARGRLCDDLFRLDPDTGDFTLLRPPQVPPACCGHSLTWDRADHLVCIGGVTAQWEPGQAAIGKPDPVISVWTYSLSSNKWRCAVATGQAPSHRSHHSTVALAKGRFLVFGGCSSAEPGAGQASYLNDAFELDVQSPTMPVWRRHAAFNEPPSQRSMHSCVLSGARVVLYGGYSPKHTGYEGVVVLDVKCAKEVGNLVEEIRGMGMAGQQSANVAAVCRSTSSGSHAQTLQPTTLVPVVGPRPTPSAAVAAVASDVPASHPHVPVVTIVVEQSERVYTSPEVAYTLNIARTAADEAAILGGYRATCAAIQQQHPGAIQCQQDNSDQQQAQQQKHCTEAVALPDRAPDATQQADHPHKLPVTNAAAIPQQLAELLAARHSQEMYTEMTQRVQVVTAQLQRERNICQVLRCEANAAELLRGESRTLVTALQAKALSTVTHLARDATTLQALRTTVDELRHSLAAKERDLAQAKASAEDLTRQLGLITSQFCRQQPFTAPRRSEGGNASVKAGKLPRSGSATLQPAQDSNPHAAKSAAATATAAAASAPLSHEGYSSCGGSSPCPPRQQLGGSSSSVCDAPVGESRGPECIPRGRHDSPTLTRMRRPGSSSGHSEPYFDLQQPQSLSHTLQQQHNTEHAAPGLQHTVGITTSTTATTTSTQQQQQQVDQLTRALFAAEQQRDVLAAELAAARAAATHAAVTNEACREDADAATATLRVHNAQLCGEEAALAHLGEESLRALEQQLSCAAARVREALIRRAVTDELLSCGLCMDASRAVAFGCGHQVCSDCAAQLVEECPFCRASISVRIRLFDS